MAATATRTGNPS